MSEIDWSDVAREIRKSQALPRKYASFFQWHKKEVMELKLCSELVKYFQEEGNSGFTKITEGDDPPDCIITHIGKDIAVEVTELVVQDSIEDQVRHNLAYVIGPEWTESLLAEKLNCILAKKDNPAKRSELRKTYHRYILLIHTDEDELDVSSFIRLLDKNKINRTTLIDEAYVLFSYNPSTNSQAVVRIK